MIDALEHADTVKLMETSAHRHISSPQNLSATRGVKVGGETAHMLGGDGKVKCFPKELVSRREMRRARRAAQAAIRRG